MIGNHILSQFFSDADDYHIALFGNGLIHKTYTVSTSSFPAYILQEVNTAVFKTPLDIASNLEALSNFLERNENTPAFELKIDSVKYIFSSDKVISSDSNYLKII